jgi:hypothetical protein
MDRRTREIVPWQEVTPKRDNKPLGNKAQRSPKTKKTEESSLALTSKEGSLGTAAIEDGASGIIIEMIIVKCDCRIEENK